ncbi:hypothetical protein ABVT39_016912 [Epinephelus coioides]
MKDNADHHNRAQPSILKPGDIVLCRQLIKGKLMTPYKAKPYIIFKLDLNQRRLMKRMIWIHNLQTHQIIITKNRTSTSTLLSSHITPREQIGDHHNVSLRL